MRKILIVAMISSVLCANDIDFKKGFDMAVKAIQLELINGSNSNRAMNYHYPKTIYLDTKSMSTNEILLAQYIAFSNGYLDTVFAGEKMYFGSYLRDADRDLAKSNLQSLLNKTLKTENNTNKIKYATPILNRSLYVSKKEIVESSIKRAEFSEWSYRDSRRDSINNNVPNTEKIKKKNFFIPKKNKTNVYYIEPKKLNKNSANSKDIKKTGITNMSKFRYGRTIQDENGKRYIKIHNDNLYIKEDDVIFTER